MSDTTLGPLKSMGIISYLLFGSKVVHYVEELSDLLRRLALNHIGDGLAANIAIMKQHTPMCSISPAVIGRIFSTVPTEEA
jgi:hypothetical protein